MKNIFYQATKRVPSTLAKLIATAQAVAALVKRDLIQQEHAN